MTRREILEKNWKDFRLSIGLEYEPMSDKSYEFMEKSMEEYAELRLEDVSGECHIIKGELIDYSVFTPTNKNHLKVEIFGEENHIGNKIKIGDKIELRYYR